MFVRVFLLSYHDFVGFCWIMSYDHVSMPSDFTWCRLRFLLGSCFIYLFLWCFFLFFRCFICVAFWLQIVFFFLIILSNWHFMLYRKNIFEWQEENRTKITQTGVHALTMFLISVQEWQNQNNQTGVHALTMFLISVQECYILCFLSHLQRLIWHSVYREKRYIKYIARNWYVLLLYSQQMETELRSWNDNADAIQIYCSIFHEEW